MRIRFLNTAVKRMVDDLEWSTKNGHVATVSGPDMAGDLLTHEGFVIAEDEPLLRVMSTDEALSLVIDGRVAQIGTLANMKSSTAKAVAKNMGVAPKIVLSWIDAAGRIILEVAKEETAVVAADKDGGETAVSSTAE